MTDPELLLAARIATGLSGRKLGTVLLGRDERTVRRWEAGTSPMPGVVRRILEHVVALRPERAALLVELLSEG